MYVVMVSPECAPVAKVGGLGDVVQGLSYELSIRGNLVELILPKYDCMRYDRIWGLTRVYEGLMVPHHNQWIHCDVFFGFVDGLKCFFYRSSFSPEFLQSRNLLRPAGRCGTVCVLLPGGARIPTESE